MRPTKFRMNVSPTLFPLEMKSTKDALGHVSNLTQGKHAVGQVEIERYSVLINCSWYILSLQMLHHMTM